jgi:hypothetical protein
LTAAEALDADAILSHWASQHQAARLRVDHLRALQARLEVLEQLQLSRAAASGAGAAARGAFAASEEAPWMSVDGSGAGIVCLDDSGMSESSIAAADALDDSEQEPPLTPLIEELHHAAQQLRAEQGAYEARWRASAARVQSLQAKVAAHGSLLATEPTWPAKHAVHTLPAPGTVAHHLSTRRL